MERKPTYVILFCTRKHLNVSSRRETDKERESENERANCSCSQVRRKCVSWGREDPISAAIRPTLAIPLAPFGLFLAHATLHGNENEACGSRRSAARRKAKIEEREMDGTVIPPKQNLKSNMCIFYEYSVIRTKLLATTI